MRKLLIALLAVMGAWLVLDGLRAVVTGDYATMASGRYAGQLGPWAGVVQGVGLDPLGYPVRLAHIGAGLVALIAAFFIAAEWGTLAWVLGFLASGAMLWYLPVGTITGVGAALLLLVPSVRIEIRGR